MKNEVTQLVIKFPNGSSQVVKPLPSFNGNWQQLAEAVGRQFYPHWMKIKYELR